MATNISHRFILGKTTSPRFLCCFDLTLFILANINDDIRDLFHAYFNRFEFHFLRLHINETNKFCFFVQKGNIPGFAK